jgi:hypothetical protein
MGLRVNGARVPPTQKGIVATGDVDLSGANALAVPSHATAGLPATATAGALAWDTTDSAVKIYVDAINGWAALAFET